MNLSPAARHSIDWTCLFTDDKLASWGLQELLKARTIELRFEPASEMLAPLWSLYWSYRMGIRLRGQHTLHFCYPTFYSAETGSMPLMRWPGYLEPPRAGETQWYLRIASEGTAQLNPHWLSWAQATFPHDWDTRLAEVARAGERTPVLRQLAAEMSQEMQWTVSNPDPGLIKEASLRSFAEELKRGGLAWLATLQIDAQGWKTVNVDADWADWPLPEQKVFTYPYLLPLAPATAAAWQQLGAQARVAIAQRGSIHSTVQLLEQVLFPHLVAGEPVLLVGRDQCTLDAVVEQLTEQGWGKLLSRWQDEGLDWPILRASVLAHLKQEGKIATSSVDASWQVTYGRYRREEQQLQEALRTSRRAVFGKARWQDVLGSYLRASRREGKALLATHLQAGWYTFTPKEYEDIQRAIKQTKPLHTALDSLHHPLVDLNAAIFIHQDEAEAVDFITRTCRSLLDLVQPLHQRYIRRQSEYADQLMLQLETTYLELRKRWANLNALLSDLTRHYGNDVLTLRQGTLRLKAAFSKRWQAATRERQALIKAYTALHDYHKEQAPFTVEWLLEQWTERPVDLPAFLEAYERKLTAWQLTLPTITQEELLRLNYKTADPALPASAHVHPLEIDLEASIDEVNALGLYQLPLQSKHLTLLRQQRYLEEIIERLERTQAGIEPFSAFYAWQRNWFSLSEIARKSIQAILRTRPADWSAAFASWYFNECLSQTHAPALSFRLSAAKDGVYGREQLWQRTRQQVWADWWIRRTAAAKMLQLATHQKNLSLETLPDGVGDALSRFAPITIATPELGAQLQAYYPYLVVLEAQRLRSQELSSLIRPTGQRATVLYDADISNAPEWQEAWRAADWPELAAHTASWAAESDPILPPTSLRTIPGLFQSATAHNEEEALAVLDWLNTLPTERGQRIASVGILCFTEGQRNRILQLLYEVKKTHGAAAEHLQRLERNGLQVLTLTDLADHTFTQLLVSVTYGPQDASGALPGNLANIPSSSLWTLLKCWARAQGAHWLCSLPPESWSSDEESGAMMLPALLVRSLRYAIASPAEAEKAMIYHLPSLTELRTDQRGEFDPLARELIFRIGDHFPYWQWSYHRSLGPAHALLEARTLEGQRILFLPDGFLSQSEYSTFYWEWTQRERLQAAGYLLVDVPLTTLWKSPTTAFHQLLRRLRALTVAGEEE
jgi:hypothetical protein